MIRALAVLLGWQYRYATSKDWSCMHCNHQRPLDANLCCAHGFVAVALRLAH